MEHNCETKWRSIDIDEIKMEHNCETESMSIDIDEINYVTQVWNEMNINRHWWN